MKKPFQGICTSPLNLSPAKFMFSFSKAERFPGLKPNCPNHSYFSRLRQNARKASFGYGHKYDFTIVHSKNQYPSPCDYQTLDKSGKDKSKGKTFGVSRQSSPDKSYIVQDVLKFPAPNKYNKDSELSNISFTIRPKYPDHIQQHNTVKLVPGPGAHEFYFPKSGRTGHSKYRSGCSFSCPKNARFPNEKQTPGPLDYAQEKCTTKNSKHRQGGKYIFDQQKRLTFTDLQKKRAVRRPGPGAYQASSQFGHYEDLNPNSNFALSSKANQTIG